MTMLFISVYFWTLKSVSSLSMFGNLKENRACLYFLFSKRKKSCFGINWWFKFSRVIRTFFICGWLPRSEVSACVLTRSFSNFWNRVDFQFPASRFIWLAIIYDWMVCIQSMFIYVHRIYTRTLLSWKKFQFVSSLIIFPCTFSSHYLMLVNFYL